MRLKKNINGWLACLSYAHCSGGKIPLIALFGTYALVVFVPVAFAQQASDPYDKRRYDSGTLLEGQRRAKDAAQMPGKTTKTVIRADIPRKETSLSSLKLSVKGFRLDGHTDISAGEIERVLSPWKDRELSFTEFEQAVHAVARYLRENGHPNAEVVVSRALIGEGMLAFAVQGLSPVPQQPVAAVAPPPMPIQEISPRVQVKSFRFSGAIVTKDDELQQVVGQWSNKSLTLKELQLSVEGVAAYLHNKGYTLAQAWLPPQRIDTGEVEIAIQEGVVDAKAGNNGLTVSGEGKRVYPQIIENMLSSGVHPGKPFKASDLEGVLLTANELPGIKSVTANLSPGTLPGTTQVEVRVEEGSLLSGSVWADNFGSVYTGQDRLNAQVNLNSPARYGEQYSLGVNHSSGMDSFKLAAQAPLGVHGAKLGASASTMHMNIGKEVAPLNLSGQSSDLSLYASYPLVRSAARNSFASLNLDSKHLANDMAGFRENDRRIDMATLSFTGDLSDRWQGKMSWGAGAAIGNLDLSHGLSYQILDSVSARTAGGFSKATWNFSRVAPVFNSAVWSWTIGLSGQFANKNLDGAEKFQLGGPSGVRAYPVGEALGDDGLLASLELRHSFGNTSLGNVQAFGFVDGGNITQYHSLWANAMPGGRPNSYSLGGYGLGASVGFGERGGVRVMVAKKLGSNPNPTSANTDSDGERQSARIWIIGNILF